MAKSKKLKRNNTCSAKTLAGNPCRGKPIGRSKFCMSHSKKTKKKKKKRSKSKNKMRKKLKKNPGVSFKDGKAISHDKEHEEMYARIPSSRRTNPDDCPDCIRVQRAFADPHKKCRQHAVGSIGPYDVSRIPEREGGRPAYRWTAGGYRQLDPGSRWITRSRTIGSRDRRVGRPDDARYNPMQKNRYFRRRRSLICGECGARGTQKHANWCGMQRAMVEPSRWEVNPCPLCKRRF